MEQRRVELLVSHCETDSRQNLDAVSIDDGEPVQVTHKYSLNAAIAPDGKLIACSYQDEHTMGIKLALIPFEGEEPSKFLALPPGAQTSVLRWTSDGQCLVL